MVGGAGLTGAGDATVSLYFSPHRAHV